MLLFGLALWIDVGIGGGMGKNNGVDHTSGVADESMEWMDRHTALMVRAGDHLS